MPSKPTKRKSSPPPKLFRVVWDARGDTPSIVVVTAGDADGVSLERAKEQIMARCAGMLSHWQWVANCARAVEVDNCETAFDEP